MAEGSFACKVTPFFAEISSPILTEPSQPCAVKRNPRGGGGQVVADEAMSGGEGFVDESPVTGHVPGERSREKRVGVDGAK
jgi:FlaG/FlaF family flagellin (archaellin)